MDKLLRIYINNPSDAEANFNLAKEYEVQRHFAAAVTHYLKCAEYSNLVTDKLLAYESLIRAGLCFGHLGGRESTESGWLLQAIALCPDRPEAYWLISMFYERHQNWFESYTMACIGLTCPDIPKHLRIGLGFEKFKLLFQKGLAGWWIGKNEEARDIFQEKLPYCGLDSDYWQVVKNNSSFLNA